MDLDLFKRWMWLRTLYLKWRLPVRYPLILNIEPTNRCNLACAMCPRSISGRPVVDMEWGLFERIVGELKREGPILKVFLQKDGEPLLHPKIANMVESLVDARAAKSISIITNGTLLSEDMFADLAAAGLDDLIVSIDAVEPAGYEKLKGANAYERVVANVDRAIAMKREHNLKKPLIKARMVERRGHAADVEAFRRRWAGKADMVDITPYHTWIGAVGDERCYGRDGRYPCSLLWYTGIVNSDGQVSPCCIDYECRGSLGRVGEGGFKEIWNGKALHELRMKHLKGEFGETAICGNCEYWLIKEDIGAWLRRIYRISNTPATGGGR